MMDVSRVKWEDEEVEVNGEAVDLVTLVTKKETTALEDLVSKFNTSYQRRRYLAIVQNKEATSVADSKSGVSNIEVLTPPYPIRSDRSRLVVERFLNEARKNRAPECSLYIPSEGKFLCVGVDTASGKHFLQLLEGDRFFPSVSCGKWRVLPADRNSKDKLMLLQNCFSNKYVGHDLKGLGRVDQALPTKYEHLELVVDEESGFMKIICPHWHWSRGAPLVIKGPGKKNPHLWPSEVNFLEWAGDTSYSENPRRTLRCGYGGRKDKTLVGYVPALFQVVWDLPEQSKRASERNPQDIDLNWLGQNTCDFSQHINQADPTWRSPYKARVLGILP
mmetsp:Transcript_25339/g.30028  ORF Transcript_25339/g.30028 Transcript_25339/m.30028 type:complete len:333 (+) Transcript_25339:59-1057(+)